MNCSKCNTEYNQTDKFCPECGEPNPQAQKQETTPVAATPAASSNIFSNYAGLGTGDLIKLSWNIFAANVAVWIGIMLLMIIINIIPILGSLVSIVVGMMIIPYSYMCLVRYEKNQKTTFNDYFDAFKNIFSFIGIIAIFMVIGILYFAVNFMVIVSTPDFLSGIVPLFIFLFNFIVFFLLAPLGSFSYLGVYANDYGVIESISKGFSIILSNIVPIVINLIVMGIIIVISLIPLGLGAFITFPMTYILLAALYIKFTGGGKTNI